MAGFQMNLKKDKINKPNSQSKPKISFAFGGSKTNIIPKKSIASSQKNETRKLNPNALLGSESESEGEDAVVAIDSFDKKKGGAIAGNKAVNTKVTEPLIIKPTTASRDWKEEIRKKQNSMYIPNQEHRQKVIAKDDNNLEFGLSVPEKSNSKESVVDAESNDTMSKEERIRSSLLKGEELDDKGLIIPIPSEDEIVEQDISSKPDEDSIEQYKEVPVDQFGAALLRGMGWKQNKGKNIESAGKPLLERRKKGVLLGIGAKAVEDELMADLLVKRGAKFDIPVVRRNKDLNATK
ncbi:DEHA2G04664p [Debaryomyces hansenii CBS767]|uniref:Pre-mRNA-splicing factor SPP2 n=1 Tax=Debaryomyces hansenii (strain ATCC 36239 / CBS 767 / BCRC 21394 / JCM 1990 / NBRC 0083 / IGC 2968) TaxID=284592 RepID=SPP2_DEBHA|nr:DEHA2G04664p [Debaryomyces hansenii CBS767]Q6BJ73.2 RecName: Full=Pre-mRNA-splicing factor SPP2 [Debaryomyces hansenii CBS767]CAG90205.2 DEHA2G04664p [Debaryomyces hansenii CBS767]|eukprot:XP_461748.2 DEHA2G04664p [Debaryomyces hansenii CBS767]